MREGWEYKKLKEIGQTQTGTTPSKSVKSYYGGEIPFIRPAELDIDGNGSIEYNSELKLTPEGALKSRMISANSILMCCIGSVGKTGYSIKDVTCNQQINTITPYEGYNSKFVYYALLTPSFQNEVIKIANSAKVTLAIISKGKWEEMSIPVPSLSTQESIVSELDKINELISLKKEQLKDYDNLAQSIFYDMFGDPVANDKGWEVKKLGEVYKVTSSKRILQQDWQTKGIPFYKVADIVNLINNELVVPAVYIKESTYEELKHKGLVPKGNDILITSRGTIGMCYIVKSSDKFYFQDGMITWLLQKEGCILPQYLKSLFEVKSFLDTMLDKVNISTVAYLSIKQMSNATIPLPPLPLQQAFAKRIEAIEQQKQLISSEIKDLETLLASRMQYWFD